MKIIMTLYKMTLYNNSNNNNSSNNNSNSKNNRSNRNKINNNNNNNIDVKLSKRREKKHFFALRDVLKLQHQFFSFFFKTKSQF